MYSFSILVSKIIYIIIRFFKLGAGFTYPGHLILKINPKIMDQINKHVSTKRIFVSGTNGKTTTSKLIAHILRHSKYLVVHNESGANLASGVVSAVLLNSNLFGKLEVDYLIFELDESSLVKVLPHFKPDILVLLNLSRDQLDRYWEVDLIFERWQRSLRLLGRGTTLVLDGTSPKFSQLVESFPGRYIYFDDSKDFLTLTSLRGGYNAKNVNCALIVARELGISAEVARESLATFSQAFGRGECVSYRKQLYKVYLAKNPESLNQNLNMLLEDGGDYDACLFVLNDNIPDGRDVSWIYDVSPNLLRKVCVGKHVYVSGTRALDLAIRLDYAGINPPKKHINPSILKTVNYIADNLHGKTVATLPNYSAMLNLRKVLLGRKIL